MAGTGGRVSTQDDYRPETRRVAQRFSAAAHRYDAAAYLQRVVREELESRVATFAALQPRCVVDLGAGTGHAALALKRRFGDALVLAVDIAPGMLAVAGERMGWRDRVLDGKLGHRFERICADTHRLPIATGSCELAFSSLMLQWSHDLDAAFVEIRRVLKPGGLLAFASFGPRTLHELRAAWASVDDQPHVGVFADMHDLGGALARAGFSEPVLDVDLHELRYSNARALMQDLKAIGAANAVRGRARGLTGRSRFARMAAAYEQWRSEDSLPASYEVVYGLAWAAPLRPGIADAGGEVAVAVEAIRRRAEKPSA